MLHAALTVRLPSASPMPIPPPSVTPRWQAAVNDPAMGTPLVRVRSTDGAAFGVSADLLSATQINTLRVHERITRAI